MPRPEQFKTPELYTCTLAHELTHWTGGKARLNRSAVFDAKFETRKESYAFEELVAELGSAFLMAEFGMASESFQHTEYLKSWIKALKDDKRLIFTASRHAQDAMTFIRSELLEEGEELAA